MPRNPAPKAKTPKPEPKPIEEDSKPIEEEPPATPKPKPKSIIEPSDGLPNELIGLQPDSKPKLRKEPAVKQDGIPSDLVLREPPATKDKPIEEESPAPPVQVIERRIETVMVEIPLGEPPHRFQSIHLEALLYGEHAHTFARLRQALRDKDTRTADRKEVKSGPDILRWLLEQVQNGS